MSKSDFRRLPPANLNSLQEAIRAAKIAAADRGDVVVDLKEADRARLEILADELKPVFADIPPDDDQFDGALSSGLQPRFWIDSTAHVMMGRDRRTYRFVRDTRLGRVVLAESADVKAVADRVTGYIADRIVERRRMMEGFAESVIAPAGETDPRDGRVLVPEDKSWDGFVTGTLWFLIGALVGGGFVVAWMWERIAG